MQNNQAKYAFFYVISLISLIALATAVGSILFQIINKNVVDVLGELRGSYSSSSLRFALASIIISAPVYYYVAYLINKSLFKGELEKESEIRKWLSYLILLISFVVMSGWFVGIVFNFLDGELTLKFILKALVAVGITATIFSYYFYDLKRTEFEGVKNNVNKIYFYASLLVVLASMVSAFIFVESPKEARQMKIDIETLNRLNQVEMSVQQYYSLNEFLPNSLEDLLTGNNIFLRENSLYNPTTKEAFEYTIVDETKYEICTSFLMSNKDQVNDYRYINDSWLHDSGRQCFVRSVADTLAPRKF